MAVLPVCENEYIERTLVMETNQKQFYSKICKPSDLVDIQKYINDVLELRGFNSQSAQDKMLLLTEEIGELAKAVRKDVYKRQVFRKQLFHLNGNFLRLRCFQIADCIGTPLIVTDSKPFLSCICRAAFERAVQSFYKSSCNRSLCIFNNEVDTFEGTAVKVDDIVETANHFKCIDLVIENEMCIRDRKHKRK